MSADEQSAWQDKRRDVAAQRAAALQRRKAVDSQQARKLVNWFVREARERELATTSLRSKAQNGRTTYRTALTGWYLKRDGSLAIGVDGGFYIMSSPPSLRARFTGVVLHPAEPPLVVGVGGRDGDSMSLEELLGLRLDAGDAFPNP
jgi:hypothetical protein